MFVDLKYQYNRVSCISGFFFFFEISISSWSILHYRVLKFLMWINNACLSSSLRSTLQEGKKKTSNLFSNFHYVKFSVKTMKKKKTLYSNLDLSQIAQRLCNLRSLNKTSELITVAI